MSATHSRARGELSRRIRTRLAHAELSRVQLANAAELSVTTINNALNPMKDPPTADALNRLAAALDVTGTALTQWRVLRDRADASPRPDSPYLFHYLRAARRAACQRLYPGAVPGTIPPLPTIYVSRSAYPDSRAWTASPLHWRTGQRIAAEAILEQGQNCLILGEPGSGKSTLLRAGLTIFNCGSYWRGVRSSLGLARKPSSRPGWYCIRRSFVLTSAVSRSMSCLTRLASERFRTDQTGSTGFSSGA